MISSPIPFRYPRQYWLMIAGIVLSTAGGSMIWPFLLIYASAKLNMPLSSVAVLISINAGTGLFSSFIAGTLADKIGRKFVMTLSLFVTGLAYFLLMRADIYAEFAGLMFMIGLFNPLYQVGADAMLADLIPSERRTDAYAINRIANNAAFGIGPVVGGILATRSYDFAFLGAATGFIGYGLLLLFLAHETLDKQYRLGNKNIGSAPLGQHADDPTSKQPPRENEYLRVFRDGSYIAFVSAVAVGLIAPSMVWILLPVYTKTGFGLSESQYGWIPTTNALMCVFVQYFVTLITRRHRTLPVSAVGMLFYALGAGSVALMTGFWGFWLSMVILTFGELILVPTTSKYVADRAPADLRGRYMSIYWISWALSRALAPIIGGYINDKISPVAIWIGGLVIGLASTLTLILLAWLDRSSQTASLLSTPEA